jgi:deferrochelatase/peroxidase EfeB
MSISRRQLVGVLGAGLATGSVGTLAAHAVTSGPDPAERIAAGLREAVPFHGRHQAGITTSAQDRMHFAAFDVTTPDRARLVALLRSWTDAARRMTTGADAGPGGAFGVPAEAPPDDTGEATGLPASGLTLTVGFGPSLFRHPQLGDRFELASRRPPALVDLPAFPGDNLDPNRSGGDLCVQACAHDPQVASHAIRNLARIGFGTVAIRWSQLGFGRTSSTSRSQDTPRNLMGQKDGTDNLKAEDTALLDEHLWAKTGDGAVWMQGGAYLVARRIRMHIETWDRTGLGEQESIIGRFKGSGAPLTGRLELDTPDFRALRPDGTPVIDPNAHVRLVHPSSNNDARLLRRGYNFIDGNDQLGRMEAGLFFLAYQRDPRRQYIPIQQRMARSDLLNEYIQHVGSAIFAVPPGVEPSGHWGDTLLAAPEA